MGKVILIGGSPMVGKTTLAIETASREKTECVCTDDIIRIIEDVSGKKGSSGKNYLEYYESTPLETLIDDTRRSHELAEDVLKNMIIRHSTWGDSIVIEGWAIYPHMLDGIMNDNIETVFLVGTEELFKLRIENNRYYCKASDLIKEKYVSRSLWHNSIIMSECIQYGYDYILR